MAYKNVFQADDETLFRTLVSAKEHGALVMVHAENGDVIDYLTKKALAEGNTGIGILNPTPTTTRPAKPPGSPLLRSIRCHYTPASPSGSSSPHRTRRPTHRLNPDPRTKSPDNARLSPRRTR